MKLTFLILIAFNIAVSSLAEAEVYEHLWNHHILSSNHKHVDEHHHHHHHDQHAKKSKGHDSKNHDHQISSPSDMLIQASVKFKSSKYISSIDFYYKDLRQLVLLSHFQNFLWHKNNSIIPPPKMYRNLPLLI